MGGPERQQYQPPAKVGREPERERQISGIQVFEGFRPPYADENVRTGFSGVVLKSASGKVIQPKEATEPTESEAGASVDEGTVYSKARPAPKQEGPP